MSAPNLRELILRARAVGIEPEHLRGTGELRFAFGGRRVRINGRRKDGARALIVLIRRAEETACITAGAVVSCGCRGKGSRQNQEER